MSTREKFESLDRRIQKDKKTGCHIWTGSTVNTGKTPFVIRKGKRVNVRRAFINEYQGYEMTDAEARAVRMSCGNGLCVNPAHAEFVAC